jgi:hypothetical protein
VAAGEVHFLFERGVAGDQVCGCGERFSACPFWQAVGDEAFGGWGTLDVESLVEADREVDRLRRLHLLAAPGLSAPFAERLSLYADALARVYGAIATVSGSPLVVDSSKTPHFALVARRAPGAELRIVHLVRDSRAVAHSWTRAKARLEPINGQAIMDRYRPSKSAYRWMLDNALFDAFALAGIPRLLVRYEALVDAPQEELGRIARFAGLDPSGDYPFLAGREASLGVHHTVAGNPNRLEQGRVELVRDDEWRGAMSARDRRTVAALTLPLLVRYGYVPARGSAAGSRQ